MKKIFKKIGVVLCSLTLAIASFFLPMKNYNKSLVASADTINTSYSFNSSDIIVCGSNRVDSTGQDSIFGWTKFSFNISTTFVNNSKVINFSTSGVTITRWGGSDFSYANFNSSFVFGNPSSGTNYYKVFLNSSHSYYIGLTVNVNNPTDFIADIYKIRIYTEDLSRSNDTWYRTHIVYYDVNDNFIDFSHQVYMDYVDNFAKSFMLSDRIYFLNDIGNLTDTQQYNLGYQQGLADNQQTIYQNGYNAGNIAGYNTGKNDGIASANNYSFIALIGSVVDVPFQTFKGALNYEILGVNLYGLFTGLITLCIILFIVKLILGGK